VVRNLEEIERRQAATEELRVDAFLDIAREQEPLAGGLAEQHDGHVVDRRSAIGWMQGHAVGVRPQDAEVDRVERQLVAGRQPPMWRAALGEDRRPCVVARPGPGHARLVDPPDPIPSEQRREARDVVLVRVREHEDVDPPVPRRQALVEGDEQSRRVRAAIHDHPTAPIALDQDPVALSDIEHDDVDRPVRPIRERQGEADRGGRQRERGDLRRSWWPGHMLVPLAGRGRGRGGSFPWLAEAGCRARHVPHPTEDRLAPACADGNDHGRQDRRDDVPRRLQREAGEGQAGADPDGGDHRRVQHPGGQSHERRDDARQAESGRDTDDERERARGHGRGDQRDHDEVHDRRDEGQPTEVQQDDRGRGGLRGEGDAEDIRDEAPRATRRGTGDSLRETRSPGEDPGGRQRRKAEPGVVDPGRVDEQQCRARPAERGNGAARPADLPSQQHDAGHGGRAHHRWRRAHERDVEHDAGRGEESSAPPPQGAGQRAERRGDDRDVPARDRDDMTRAGGREGRGEVAIDEVAQPDQHPGREACLGFRQRPLQALRGSPAPAFEQPVDGVRGGQHRQRARPQRAGRTDVAEVVAVLAFRRRPDPAIELHAVAGHDGRVPGQRRGHQHAAWRVEPDRRRSGPVTWRPDGLDHPDPRPVALGSRWQRTRRTSTEHATNTDRRDAERHREQDTRPRAPRRRGGRDREQERCDSEERGDAAAHRTEAQGPGTRADREPRRARHQRTVTRDLS
jgi:hypothetical protein